MPTIAANTRTHQLFCRDEEHRLATLALVKEVVNSADLKNHASAGLVETALLNLRLVRYIRCDPHIGKIIVQRSCAVWITANSVGP